MGLRTKETGLSEVRNRTVLHDFAYYCKEITQEKGEREEEMKRVIEKYFMFI